MLPGPIRILKAPGCQKPVKLFTLASGNTFGARYWTDGKRGAPMLPNNPRIRKSPKEGVLFWLDDCEEIGQIQTYFRDEKEEINPEWDDLEFAAKPTEADYLYAIENGIGDTKERIRYLRVLLWWAGNDPIRKGEADTLSDMHLENLRKLEQLLSKEDPNDRLMRAEVCREVGKFDEALDLLDYPFPEGYMQASDKIRSLCLEGDSKVACINPVARRS